MLEGVLFIDIKQLREKIYIIDLMALEEIVMFRNYLKHNRFNSGGFFAGSVRGESRNVFVKSLRVYEPTLCLRSYRQHRENRSNSVRNGLLTKTVITFPGNYRGQNVSNSQKRLDVRLSIPKRRMFCIKRHL